MTDRRTGRGKRPTIQDIADRAGMAKSTVSNALNGQSGVSEAARQRVIEIAQELQWKPSSAARALSASRTGTVGFVIARPATLLGTEAFFMQMIAGIETELSAAGVDLLLSTTTTTDDEIATIERWVGERRVDGVFITDLRRDDTRLELVQTLGVPAVAFGLSEPTDGVSGVFCDEQLSIAQTVDYLAALGHRRIARVGGREDFLNTWLRDIAFDAAVKDRGLDGEILHVTEYSADEGAQTTRALLSSRSRPTAVLYENEVMASAGSKTASEMGFAVPTELSVVSIGDFPLCSLVTPPLTALGRDVTEFGSAGARALLSLIDSGTSQLIQTRTPRLVTRDSTAVFESQHASI